jgi:hypothetical protein
MYQALIWPRGVPGDHASCLRPAFHPQDLKRLADSLIDGVRRDFQLAGDFLGGKMLVDEAEAIQLARTQPANPLLNQTVVCRVA